MGTVAPNVGPEYVTEVLGSLEQSLWYVHRDGELLKFDTRPNIYRVIAQTAGNQSPESVNDRLKDALEKAAGSPDGFRVITWADADGSIADTPEPTIAILPSRYAIESLDERSQPTDWEAIERLWDRVGGGLRTYRNSLLLVAPDRQLWNSAEEAVREVLAYDTVLGGRAAAQLGEADRAELTSRRRDKQDSLATSIVTAYRWAFYPMGAGLEATGLPIPATKGQQVASRLVERLSDSNYENPKILSKIGASYFHSKVAPGLWKDQSAPLDLGEASRRFPQWTFLPILPRREETLLECVREGVAQNRWAVAIGDNATSTYQQLIETPGEVDRLTTLFDGSASLVTGDLLELIREHLRPVPAKDTPPEETPLGISHGVPGKGVIKDKPTDPVQEPLPIPAPKRLGRVRLNVQDLAVGKTNNLQPYLFRFLQEVDAAAEVNITIDVSSSAGIPEDILENRIVEGLDQLGIVVRWEEG